jgi:hypothetical protein
MQNSCIKCGKGLIESEIKKSRKMCISCRQAEQIIRLLADHNLARMFVKGWSAKLLLRYYKFLEKRNLSPITKRRNILLAINIISNAEKTFLNPDNITLDWLNSDPDIVKDVAAIKSSLFPFLVEEKILHTLPKDEIKIGHITKLIQSMPDPFRRLIKIHLNEMLSLRERQINIGALKPMTLHSIQSDIQSFNRFLN